MKKSTRRTMRSLSGAIKENTLDIMMLVITLTADSSLKAKMSKTFKNVAISAKTEEPTATKDKGIPNATTKTEEDTTANAATIGGPEATTETTSKIMATTSQDSLR